jgi:hypothetical protein
VNESKDWAHGWVTSSAESRQREETLHEAFVGRRIERVRYFEIDYGLDEWLASAEGLFDSIDFGVELDLDDGTTWAFIWDMDGPDESLLVTSRILVSSQLDPRHKVWDVTERWSSRGEPLIFGISTSWLRHAIGPSFDRAGNQVGEAYESHLCMVAVSFAFEGGWDALIALGEERDGAFAFIPDNVSVFFSLENARRAGALPLPDER